MCGLGVPNEIRGWGYGGVSDSGFFVARWEFAFKSYDAVARGEQGAVDAGAG